MNAHWRIRLDDENGRFWLSGERRWSDAVEDSIAFSVEAEARTAALEIQAKADANPEWFPKIKVVAFRA
jgi:hypothetical protein